MFKKYDDDRDGYITLSFEEFLTGKLLRLDDSASADKLDRNITAAMSVQKAICGIWERHTGSQMLG